MIVSGMAVGVRERSGLAIVEEVEAVRLFAKWPDLATTIAPGMAGGVRLPLDLATDAWLSAANRDQLFGR